MNTWVQGKFPEHNTNGLCAKINNLQIGPHKTKTLLHGKRALSIGQNASFLFRREVTKLSGEIEDIRGGIEEGQGEEGQDQVWEEIGRFTEGQEIEESCVTMGYGELRVATRKSQMTGK